MTITYKNRSGIALQPPTSKAPSGEPDMVFDWSDLVGALFASRGISKGWWRIGVKMRFAALTFQMVDPAKNTIVLPTALVGIESVALFKTTEGGDLVFDAATGKLVPAGTAAPAAKPALRKSAAAKKR